MLHCANVKENVEKKESDNLTNHDRWNPEGRPGGGHGGRFSSSPSRNPSMATSFQSQTWHWTSSLTALSQLVPPSLCVWIVYMWSKNILLQCLVRLWYQLCCRRKVNISRPLNRHSTGTINECYGPRRITLWSTHYNSIFWGQSLMIHHE